MSSERHEQGLIKAAKRLQDPRGTEVSSALHLLSLCPCSGTFRELCFRVSQEERWPELRLSTYFLRPT